MICGIKVPFPLAKYKKGPLSIPQNIAVSLRFHKAQSCKTSSNSEIFCKSITRATVNVFTQI